MKKSLLFTSALIRNPNLELVMQLLFFSLTPICILLHLVASYQDDFVYSGSVGYLLSNAWREA